MWLQNWYKSQCNGDREHTYGIKITTLDNPGWKITIDLNETPYEILSIDSGLIERDENDWIHYKTENSKFIASGDLDKLDFLIGIFRDIVRKNSFSSNIQDNDLI